MNDKKEKLLKDVFLENNEIIFSKYNLYIIKKICKFLNIKTKFILFSKYFDKKVLEKEKTYSLIKEIIKREKVTHYINFQNGIEKKIKPYDDYSFFESNKISLIKQDAKFFYSENKYGYQNSILHLIMTSKNIPFEKIKYSKIC